MTIKEIEEKSGMLRANIRFYESEGFLNPEREKNGYRNYSEEDLEILKKIKLLRSLHISLEEIKAMHQGEQELGKTLEEHILHLTKQQEELEKSKYVCERMQRDGAVYEKLNTEQYLRLLRTCRPNVTEREEWIQRDTVEPLRAPFLRTFARAFDYLLYMLLWLLLVLLCKPVLEGQSLLVATFLCFLMWMPIALYLEPKFLYWFGATPGKMILGLQITYDLGEEMSREAAWSRAWRAVCMSHDWQYRDVFQMASIFNDMDSGKPLEWDYEACTTIELKDDKSWRMIVWLVLTAVLVFGIVMTIKKIFGV